MGTFLLLSGTPYAHLADTNVPYFLQVPFKFQQTGFMLKMWFLNKHLQACINLYKNL